MSHWTAKGLVLGPCVLSGEGMEPETKKVEAITSWPIQANLSKVRKFIGLGSYYRRYIHPQVFGYCRTSQWTNKEGSLIQVDSRMHQGIQYAENKTR